MSMAILAASVSMPSTSKPRLAMHAACVMPRYPVPNTVRRGACRCRSELEELGAGGNGPCSLPALEHRQRIGRLDRVVGQVDLEEVDAAHVVVGDGAAGGGEPVG